MRSRSHVLTLALLCPAFAVALTTTATADAAAGGPILFQGGTDHGPQIFSVNPNGSGLKQLTSLTGDQAASDPAWMPDGSGFAFSVGSEDRSDVFTARPDGSAAAKLTIDASTYHADAAYSPDGAQLAFDEDAEGGEGIFVANRDGSGAHRLTTSFKSQDAYDTEAQWSPDGTRIAFTRVKDQRQAAIFTIRTDGTDLRQLTPYKLDAASPDWSPDGTKVAFNSYWDQHPGKSANVFTINADGTNLKALTRDKGGRINSFRPSWAPDGKRLVIARAVPKGKQGRLDLYIIDRDGGGMRRLTSDRVGFAATPDWGPAAARAVTASAASTTKTYRFWSKTASFKLLGADGQPSSGEPQVGSTIIVTDDNYVGDHRHHAKTATATDHLTCTLSTADEAHGQVNALCDGQVALPGGMILVDHAQVNLAADDTVFPVTGGTGVFAKVKSGTLVSKNYDAKGDATDVTIKLR
jgi:Tol biopolymer transport system component